MPVRVLSRLFRRLFLTYLQKAFDAGELQFFSALQPYQERRAFLRYLAPTRKTKWVVYAKAPFSGPEDVLEYAARYTHRVATKASSASATTASSPIATESRSLLVAETCSKCPPPEPKSQKNKVYRDQYEELTGTSLKICPICHQGHMAVIASPMTVCSTSRTKRFSSARRDFRCPTSLQIVP